MLISQTQGHLESMLHEAGIDYRSPSQLDIKALVTVFAEFAKVGVTDSLPGDEAGDGVLAEFGTYRLRDEPEFIVTLTRQFLQDFPEVPMWQLHVTMCWPPSPETDALQSGTLWSFSMELEEFFEKMTTLPGWAWALEHAPAPREVLIMLDEL